MSRDDVKFLADQLGDLTALVRGHIEKSHEHMDIVNKHMEKSDKHIEEDIKWKKDMEPVFKFIPELATIGDGFKTANSSFKLLTWLANKWKELAILGGVAWAFIKYLYK